MINCVLWDFNGTLIDDAAYGRRVINAVLRKHGLPEIQTMEEYRERFCFPVRTFYDGVGLGGATYDQAAVEWTEEYYAHEDECRLRTGVLETVQALHALHIRQAVISASPQEALERQLGRQGITPYFERVMGLSDIHARSKVHLAQMFMRESGISPEKTLFVGDTPHDAETARAISCRCVLVTGGHQTEAALRETGCHVLTDILQVPEVVRQG